MEIHQILVSASPGDAITSAALEIRELMRLAGASDIYARFIDPALIDEVHPLEMYAGRSYSDLDADVLLFHASIGQPEVHSFLLERPERLIVVYHNISPSQPFQRYDPSFAGLLDAGRRELEVLARRTTMALADSTFNALELLDLGYTDVRVSPLIIDPSRLLDVEPHEPTRQHLAEVVDGPIALFVGQLLPHKRPDLLLEAFHVLSTYLLPEANLILVGASRLPAFSAALTEWVHELNLSRVWLPGAVPASQLVAFYRAADVFVTASEHEGFCVPLLEAMAFDVPVVAAAHGAIPETLGDGGLLLPPGEGPLLLAEAMAEVMTNGPLRASLAERGRARLAHFDSDHARATFLDHLLDVL